MRIILMRHGDAADRAPDGSMHDAARELTPQGIERLRSACATYARLLGAPTLIMHSPLRRACQSAEILRDAVRGSDDMRVVDELRPSGNVARVVDLLQAELLAGSETVAIVGHEPLLGDLLGMLSTGLDRLSLPMGTGMLAAVHIGQPQVMVGRLMIVLSQDAATQLGLTPLS